MSFKVYTHVLNTTVGNATAKLILLGLAEHAHDDGDAAFPGVDLLARYGECSERTVQRHLEYLRKHGYIRYGDQRFVAHVRGDRRPTVYEVAISEEIRTQWAMGYTKRPQADTKSRGDKPRGDTVLSPRRSRKKSQVKRGDNLSPRERGDSGVANGVTQLCHPNPPKNPPPPPTPFTTAPGVEPTAEAAEEDPTNEARDFVASLPGGLAHRQIAELSTQVAKHLTAGWPIEALRKELTTDIAGVRSHFGVYTHRLRHLPDAPRTHGSGSPTQQTPVEGQHAFVVAADDDWCARCHRPASNAVHRVQDTETTTPHTSQPASPVQRSDAALAA
ncbi:helix-turn-helix domain-containing protein [Stackebrandtia nassauensis]|uniref:Helix-turn-helix domain-containing protein n=1 Tax=Stackebrandtia nassauensis (strain DSM 44728 / CIP 108903 / NRRL B-16338 / NBRC 102104 / LLR-40K-21) TaxID=446470 RepID=D3Q401_STANL|nr:helix-turn-helix domain-containing protein [Stackebrandtia nassauensis]ADD45886.1 hypothetical protein Snas_6266 [Stackebrandtia nassauensis DSM 44728]